jgi:hypothetical protein
VAYALGPDEKKKKKKKKKKKNPMTWHHVPDLNPQLHCENLRPYILKKVFY